MELKTSINNDIQGHAHTAVSLYVYGVILTQNVLKIG